MKVLECKEGKEGLKAYAIGGHWKNAEEVLKEFNLEENYGDGMWFIGTGDFEETNLLEVVDTFAAKTGYNVGRGWYEEVVALLKLAGGKVVITEDEFYRKCR